MSEQFMSPEGYANFGTALQILISFDSCLINRVDTKYRNRYVKEYHYGNDFGKIDITPLASDLELKVFLAKENPASFKHLNDAREIAHTFVDACNHIDLISYGISETAASRLDQLITYKYAILDMYDINKTISLGDTYRKTVEKSYKEHHAESVGIGCDNINSDNLTFSFFSKFFNEIMENDFASISNGYKALSTDELFKSLDDHRGDKLNIMKDIVNWAFTEEVKRFNDDFNKIILSIIS